MGVAVVFVGPGQVSAQFGRADRREPALAGEPAEFAQNDGAQGERGGGVLPDFAVEQPAFAASGEFLGRSEQAIFREGSAEFFKGPSNLSD